MHTPPLRTVLVDDDADHRALLRDRLVQLGLPVEVVGEAGDAASGLALIRSSDPDLVLLDIEMPGGSGLDLMQALQERRCEVVLITAHPGHTHQALHLHAFDYLMKPVDALQLSRTVLAAAAKRAQAAPRPGRLAVALREGVVFLDIPAIVRCEADNVYTTLVLPDRKVVSSRPLKQFEERLVPHGFLRVHRSHLVNPAHITRYVRGEPGTLVMADGAELTLSPTGREAVLRLMERG